MKTRQAAGDDSGGNRGLPPANCATQANTRVEEVKTQGRAGDLKAAEQGSDAGSNASAGLDESIYTQGALRDPGL